MIMQPIFYLNTSMIIDVFIPTGETMQEYDAVVIGGGQSGLVAGYHLRQAGLRFVILEAGADTAGSWPQYYDSLKLFSPARYSSLPGMPFPGDPDRYPTRDEVIAYLRAYAKRFDLPVLTHQRVECVARRGEGFLVRTTQGATFSTHGVIAASGAFNRPNIPVLEGQAAYKGTILHSSAYMTPEPFAGQRVLIVGAGNSAVQIGVELAQTAQVTLASRSPIRFIRQRILGRDVHFWFGISGFDRWQRRFRRWNPTEIKPVEVLDSGRYRAAFDTGNPATRPMFSRFTPVGVAWDDGVEEAFDAVIFATGFRPNFPYLAGLEDALDEYGNARHTGGISASVAGLYYVGISGQRSFASATLRGVGSDAGHVVNDLLRSVQRPAEREAKRCCLNLMPA
jgi:putative flavoprotein involved in K+ transport